MQHVNGIIARNLKERREARKLSLDQLARASGVSRSMLAQIERGEANPSISTVWKIANGLKVSFTSLLQRHEPSVEVVGADETEPLREDEGRLRNWPIFPFDEKTRFEIFRMEIDAGGELRSEAHPEATQEYITVFAGELTVQVGEKTYRVSTGDAIRFSADQAHGYRNDGTEMVRLSMVLQYAGVMA